MKHRLPWLLLLASCGSGSPDAVEPTTTPRPSETPTSAARSSGPWFSEVTLEAGLDFVHVAGVTAERHLPETMGGGVVLFDADRDGDVDLYFPQSGSVPIPITAPRSEVEAPNQLFLNDGAGRFEDAGERLGEGAHRGYGQGASAGDVDGDGNPDLYVTNFGPDALLQGDGHGGFAEVTASAGLGDPRWTAGCLFFDADVDGDLDLYVSAYVDLDPANPAWCGRREPGWRSYCHPDHYAGLADRYWRNDGSGKFSDATQAAGLSDNLGKGLGALASDFDGDGDPDLYVANDSVENRFWRNDGSGRFADDTLVTGTGVNGRGATEAGMGLASGDIDGDLDIDLFVTNFDDESNTLYLNAGGSMFTDGTARLGLDAPSRLPVGFGTVLEDFDGDGALDLVVANGHIIHNIALYHDGKTWAQFAHLYVNSGARLGLAQELAGDLASEPFVGRGLSAGDLDGDGDADLVLVPCGGRARVYRNDAAQRAWLVISELPPGTQVVARTRSGRKTLREAGPQPTYYGQTEGHVRFALAPDDPLEALELALPGGTNERWEELPTGSARLRRGAQGGFVRF